MIGFGGFFLWREISEACREWGARFHDEGDFAEEGDVGEGQIGKKLRLT